MKNKKLKGKKRIPWTMPIMIPDLIVYIEANERLGRGYQIRSVMGGDLVSLDDDTAFTLGGAYKHAALALKLASNTLPFEYKPEERIRISRIEGDADG